MWNHRIESICIRPWVSLVVQSVKSLPAMWETWVWTLGGEDPLEEEMATHPSIPAWRIPWTEEPGGLQCMGSQKVGVNWARTESVDGQPRCSHTGHRFQLYSKLWEHREAQSPHLSSLIKAVVQGSGLGQQQETARFSLYQSYARGRVQSTMPKLFKSHLKELNTKQVHFAMETSSYMLKFTKDKTSS